MLNIIEEEENQNTLDSTQLEILNDFKSHLATEGLVSRSEVEAVEHTIGTSIITSVVDKNGLTAVSSTIGYEEVLKRVNSLTADYTLSKLVTKEELLKKVTRDIIATNKLRRNLESLVPNLSNFDKTILTKDNVRYRYDENDMLVDTLDLSILDYMYSYVSPISKTEAYQNYDNEIDPEKAELNLLNLLKPSSVMHIQSIVRNQNSVTTLTDVLNIISGLPNRLEALVNLSNDLNVTRDNIYRDAYAGDVSTNNRVAKELDVLYDILSDSPSLIVLKIFSELK